MASYTSSTTGGKAVVWKRTGSLEKVSPRPPRAFLPFPQKIILPKNDSLPQEREFKTYFPINIITDLKEQTYWHLYPQYLWIRVFSSQGNILLLSAECDEPLYISDMILSSTSLLSYLNAPLRKEEVQAQVALGTFKSLSLKLLTNSILHRPPWVSFEEGAYDDGVGAIITIMYNTTTKKYEGKLYHEDLEGAINM